ncbi:MAG: peptidylprolyl isomerase [Candidatus Diapherotrites archaeon]|nr:peptidylprolyl isomerase [Candidatus Diapherotrites archaeon]
MDSGKIVLVNYTGRITANNEAFETTVEKTAVDAGIFDERRQYKPMPVVVGSGEMLKPIEEALEKMKSGEEKKIKIAAAQAFGERKPEFIRVVPLAEFKKKNINPVPGMIISLNDMQGRVQSVSGGRVRVDFNHPLAGKELEYDIKIEKELRNNKEKIEAFFDKFFGAIPEKEKKLVIKESKVEVALDPKYSQNIAPLKKAFSELITKNAKGISSVKFVEEFAKEEPKKTKKK